MNLLSRREAITNESLSEIEAELKLIVPLIGKQKGELARYKPTKDKEKEK